MVNDDIEDTLDDKLLTCKDCKCLFIFTANEQRFFESKQLSTPKRCPQCREKRKKTLVPRQEGRGGNIED